MLVYKHSVKESSVITCFRITSLTTIPRVKYSFMRQYGARMMYFNNLMSKNVIRLPSLQNGGSPNQLRK
ncbi:hypothetical protein SAMN05421827_10285 [Pedobacter terrae]|uniref:Uncharacterized protein n=1 Tax=Pedobacter terrae TaxID=405671 RepID=A0A1G7Q0F7_9SPHI|nr:hypothetical protein SAMN05421827_10285 [Pedobacter terrae]